MNYTFSIVIPVFHETRYILNTLSPLFPLTKHKLADIIVVDGDENGSTISTLAHLPIKKTTAPKGRAYQMNKGASMASGNVLVFLHADTLLPKNALKEIHAALKRNQIVGGAFELGIDSSQIRYRFIEAAVKLRSHLTHIPYGDQAIFIKKDYFFKLGGFPNLPIMEDIALMQKVKKRGGPIAILPLKVKTSARRWEKEGFVYCSLRNFTLMVCYYLGIPPKRLATYYR